MLTNLASFRESIPVRWPWLAFVAPFAAFMLGGLLEPQPGVDSAWLALAPSAWQYPIAYGLRLALTGIVLWLVWPGLRPFSRRFRWQAAVVGALGTAVWIGVCRLGLESRILAVFGLEGWTEFGRRAAYNPLETLSATPVFAYGFLVLRFLGLAVLAPLVEELLLRGFAWRIVAAADWQAEPIGRWQCGACAATTLLGASLHPVPEMLAYVAWFSLVTALVVRTRSLADAVVAHGVTNLLLGVYVVASGEWRYL